MKVFAIAAIAMFAVSAAAQAEQLARTETGIAVHYGDLDLGAVEGQDALAARIDQAVRRECRTTRAQSVSERQACIENTRGQVMANVNGEARAALLAAQSRKGGPAPLTTLAAR